MKISFLKIVLVLVFGVFCFSFFSALPAYSGAGHNMSGYAWSSNIGWISFNCLNTNTCGTSDYGVNKDASGNLTGYAWSPNVGWIQFGGLSGFPVGTETTSSNAKVTGSSLTGWAKAISADGNGWDGWIALSGVFEDSDDYEPYGGTLVNNNFSGFAWGSEVVGWVKFDGVIVGVPPFPNLTASSPSPTTAIVNISSTYTSTITNSGNASASGTITHLFQYDNDSNHASGVTSSTITSAAIAAGGTAIITRAHTFISTGTKYIRVCADNNASFVGTVDEIDENDNCSAWTAVVVSSTPAPISGVCSSPATHYNCDSGTSANNVDGASAYTWDCLGSNGGTDTSCSENKVIPDAGACSDPDDHLNPCTSGTPSTIVNSPTRWTWTCNSPGGNASCSEKKSPGYTED